MLFIGHATCCGVKWRGKLHVFHWSKYTFFIGHNNVHLSTEACCLLSSEEESCRFSLVIIICLHLSTEACYLVCCGIKWSCMLFNGHNVFTCQLQKTTCCGVKSRGKLHFFHVILSPVNYSMLPAELSSEEVWLFYGASAQKRLNCTKSEEVSGTFFMS